MIRLARLFLLLIALATTASSQTKYLVSPDREVIPIGTGDDVRSLIGELSARNRILNELVCGNGYYGGIDPVPYNVGFGALHNDVMGQWYVTPGGGTIDTIFWYNYEVGDFLVDSTAFVRVHRSNIGPDYGPGVRPGPFTPPCRAWGYWIDTTIGGEWITAFPELATDTNWVSTYPGVVPSTPPIGENIWGTAGGYPVVLDANSVNYAVMDDLGELSVELGDKIFISIELRVPYPIPHPEEIPTRFRAYEYNSLTTSDPDYPSRNWKFYGDYGPPSICWGESNPDSVHPGWYARGSTTGDSLDVMLWDIWYTMTVTSNSVPVIVFQDDIHTTFDTGPQVVQAIIEDCNPGTPANAGVASALLRYTVNNVVRPDIVMTDLGSDIFEGTIPAQFAGSTVSWRVVATDLDDAVGEGPTDSYSIVDFGSEWFSIDTGYVCVPNDISSSGTAIDTGAFFNPYFTGSGTAPKDNGTAGPFDLGDDFVIFGDNFRYAWVGVNGAITLSKSATDTLDVNANGFATTAWNFPSPQWHGRSNAGEVGVGLMPPMFIAPMWADHIVGDSAGEYGRILYGNDGDTCLFIVQWDSVGAFALAGVTPDITTFSVILNRCTGVVEYQYESVGTTGLDSAALVGLQADSNLVSGPTPGYLFYNRLGYPIETRPRDNSCVRFYPRIGTNAVDGWTLASVSSAPLDGDYSVSHLFPDLGGSVWGYDQGWKKLDTLSLGVGFWLKAEGAGIIGGEVPSTFVQCVVAAVKDKWNLVGGPSGPVSIGNILVTGGTVASNYFGYGTSGYYAAPTIQPGYGYWMKMIGAGTLQLCSNDQLSSAPKGDSPLYMADNAASFTIRDSKGRSQTLYLAGTKSTEAGEFDLDFYELPPVPPGGAFDARFASGRMLEIIGETEVGSVRKEFPIAIRGAAYPVTLEWNLGGLTGGSERLILAGSGSIRETPLTGTGSTIIAGTPDGFIRISTAPSQGVPTAYALNRNYPNPFNPSTTFTIDLPEASDVRIEVVDILGRSVARLVTERKAAGTHTVRWDGTERGGAHVPTGVYVVRMTAGNFSTTMKMLYMK